MSEAEDHVLLGVSGSIACYKSCEITSRLTQDSIAVDVVLTETAAEMISPRVFETLSQRNAYVDLFDASPDRDPVHIDLADQLDMVLVAPATANLLGKIAGGIADDLLSSLLMAVGLRVPVYLAPAMNSNMFENPVVQENRSKLKDLGYQFIEPEDGYMACGDVGTGRLANIEKILRTIRDEL